MNVWDYIKSAKSGLWLPSSYGCMGPSPLSTYSHYLAGCSAYNATTSNQEPITVESIKKAMEAFPLPPKSPEDTLDWISGSGAIQFGKSWDEAWHGKSGNMLQLKVNDKFESFSPVWCDLKPTWFGVDYGHDSSFGMVKIPGGYAYMQNLDEHMAALRNKRDDDFEAGLQELRAASAVWAR